MKVETQYTHFKNYSFNVLDKFVLSKVLESKSGLPWANSRIFREIRKREHLYKKEEISQSPFDTEPFKYKKKRKVLDTF